MTSDYLERVDEIVINGESNPYRFERFCIAVVSHIEGGAPVVGTAASWDMGRDGFSVGKSAGTYVCTSLRDDLDNKSFSDLERITSTTRGIQRLYYCSSKNLTEHRRDLLAASLMDHINHAFPIVVLGAIQLADLGRQEGRALKRHYGPEIENVLARISAPADDQTELKGLRLALLSYGSDESVSIRNSIYQSAILDTLSDSQGKSIRAISNRISSELRLSQSVDETVLKPHLSVLVADGFLDEVNGVYLINEKGLQRVEEKKVNAASSLIEGRNAIRKDLQEAIGSQIIDDEFNRIWDIFESKMADYFQARGEQIVSEVAVFLEDELDIDKSGPPGFSFLEDFATAVAATSSHPERRQELEAAVKDLFSEKTSNATAWLVRVCAAFVAACTMGLEYKSAQAIKSLLRRVHIALDTDVVLSLLGESESDHEAAELIVRRWVGLGGTVLVGSPVLLEVAYHAYIAERDFEQIKGLDISGSSARFQFIDNVFVRSFVKLVSDGSARVSQWHQFINEYRGLTEYDYERVYAHLSSEYSIGRLPDRDSMDAEAVRQVNEYVLQEMEESALRMDRKLRDKAMRDAELYVSLATHARRIRATEPGSASLLVSSARRLASIDSHFGLSGESRLVISVQAALYLMSMLPNVSLGLSSLRTFLFEDHRNRFSSDLERTLLRMIQASESFSMPFAKRNSLMREVRSRLLKGASHVDGRPSLADVEREAIKEESRESLVQVLAESLDAISVDKRIESENRTLRRQVEELQRQLEAQKKMLKDRRNK